MNITYNLISIFLLCFCVYAGLYNYRLAASFCFVLCLAFLFVANIERIKKAKVSTGGFEFEAREVIQKAEITIREMHELSKLVAQTALSLVKRSSRMGGYSEGEQETIKENVLDLLSQLDVKKEDQEKLLTEWYEYTEIDYVLLILGTQTPSKWPSEEKQRWHEMRKDLKANRPTPAQIKELLKRNTSLSELHEEAIKDYEYYLQHKKHRRPDFWLNHRESSKQFNL